MRPAASSEYSYTFTLSDGRVLRFTVDTDDLGAPDPTHAPEWTALDHHKCDCCPLASTPGARCPAALSLVDIIDTFDAISSVETVHTEVRSSRRTVIHDGDAQSALRSLMGLVMPLSGCPVLGRLRPLARHHLPFADRNETVFRVVGAYLLEQYLKARLGGDPDWELREIRTFYRDLQTVNIAFAARIRAASGADASSNAVVALFSLATLVSMSMDDDLRQVRDGFSPR